MDVRQALIVLADIAASATGSVPEAARIHVGRGKAVAWDGAISVEVFLDAAVDEFAVDADFVGKLARKLEVLKIELDTTTVTFSEGDIAVQMFRYPVQAYPHPRGTSIGKMRAVDLGQLLETAANFTSDGNPVTANVYVLNETVMATDSVIAAALPLEGVSGIVLPGKAAKKLAKLLKQDEDGVLMLDIQHVDAAIPEERGYRFVCSEYSIFVLCDAELRFPFPEGVFELPVEHKITIPIAIKDLIKPLPKNETLRIVGDDDLTIIEAQDSKIVFRLGMLGARPSCRVDMLARHLKMLLEATGEDFVMELTDSTAPVRVDGKFVLAPLK